MPNLPEEEPEAPDPAQSGTPSEAEAEAARMGFDKVSEQKLAVAQKIKEYFEELILSEYQKKRFQERN